MIQRILAVLNDLENSDHILKRSVDFTLKHDAVLEVLFVHETPLFTIPDFFLPHDKTGNSFDETKIRDSLSQKIKELGYEKDDAIFVFEDDTADRTAALAKESNDTLVIAAYHKHISEDLVSKCHPPVLLLKNKGEDNKKATMPIEMNKSTKPCINRARELFPTVQLKLVYDNHYLMDKEETKAQKEAYEKFLDENGLKGDYIEEFAWNEADYGEDFSLMESHLLKLIEKNESDLTLLCSVDGEFIYGEAVAFALLHRAATDFFFCRYA